MADVAVRIDPQALADYLRSSQGPVLRRLIEDAELVKQEAKARVGVDTGRLRDTIVKRIVDTPAGPGVLVGSSEPYAEVHHEGSRPHVITPRTRRVLRFPASKGSSVFVFARRVLHPGTKPNRFLTDALRAVIQRRY